MLPVLCNQKMNSYLKEIADVCGIKKNLTTHTARHSFASVIALANNVSLPNVAKMLGHSTTRMTQHYAKVLDQTILKDMQEVEKHLSVLPIDKASNLEKTRSCWLCLFTNQGNYYSGNVSPINPLYHFPDK